MLSKFRTLSKIILCAMLMNPMYLLNHLIPSSDPKQPAFGWRPPSQKILYCSLLACWPAFGRRPPSQKFCIVPFWSFLLACRPAFGWPPPSPKFGTGAKFFFVVSGKIASRTSLAAGGLRPPPARSVRFAQITEICHWLKNCKFVSKMTKI